MKRLLFLFIAFCLLVPPLAGCGDDHASTTAQSTSGTSGQDRAEADTDAADHTPRKRGKPSRPAQDRYETASKPATQHPEPLAASALYERFQQDAAAAEKQYTGKTLRVSGVVWKVDTKEDTRGKPYLTLKTGSMFGSVICFFDRAQIPELKALKAGGKILVTGRCSGQKAGVQNVHLTDCTLP